MLNHPDPAAGPQPEPQSAPAAVAFGGDADPATRRRAVRNRNALPPARRRTVRHARRPHRYSSGWSIPERSMKLGQPLRFATTPESDESLVGVAARATADHVLLDLNRVLRRAGISMDSPGHLSRLDPQVLSTLAPILGCATDDIVALITPNTLPDAINSPVAFGDVLLKSHDVETRHRRISPIALKDSPHHREAWLIRILPYCPTSFEMLRSDCSECGAALRWKQSLGIGICEICEAVVGPTDAPLLEEALRPDYALFAHLLSRRPAARLQATGELAAGVRHVDSETLVRLVLSLGACVHLEKRVVDRKQCHRVPPATLGSIVSTGTGMLRTWPEGLQGWARAEAAKLADDVTGFKKLREALRRLGQRSLVSEAQASLVQAALPDLFGNIQRSFKPPSDTLLRCEASAMLGIVPETLLELVDARVLPAEILSPDGTRHMRFDRTVIEELRLRMDRSVSIPQLSRTAGLPFYAIDNMCDHGMLDRETHPAIRHLRHAGSVTNASVARLRELVLRKDGSRHPDDAIALGTALRRIGGRLKPWTDVMDALRNKTLPYWPDPASTADTPWLRAILVRPADLAVFDGAVMKSANGAGHPPPEDCSLTEAKDILNLHGMASVNLQEVFADEIAERPQWGPRKNVAMASVLAIAGTQIAMAEMCARAGWNPRQAKWALGPYEHLRTACGWDRYAIENSGVLTEQIDWRVRAHRRESRSVGGVRL